MRYMKALRAVDHNAVSEATSVDTGDESIVQQQFAGEVDINTIVRRFGLTGAPLGTMEGVYGDFTGIEDFSAARDALDRIEANFMLLPADVRDEFDNDPGAFMEFIRDRDPADVDRELSERVGRPVVPPEPKAPAPKAKEPAPKPDTAAEGGQS